MPAHEFKSAEFIELHDAGVCLSTQDNLDAYGWREFREYEGGGFSILGEDICRLAQIFGLDPEPILAKSTQGEIQRIDPECLEFRIIKSRQDIGKKTDSRYYGGMEQIKNIWAKIDAPQLLQLKVEFFSPANQNEATTIKHISYSGHFSVWWK